MAGLALLGSASAEEIRLRRGAVVPVRFDRELSLKDNRVGDRFEAIVEQDRDLPTGTRFQGEVVEIRAAQGSRPGYMDLEFDTMILPDGEKHRILAVPIRMDDKSVRRGGDGRFTAKKKLEDSGKHVVGGMVGGYILGKILGNKEAEGLIIGAMAGVIAAEVERNKTANETVVKRDSKLGVLFERDVQVEYQGHAYLALALDGRELRFDEDALPYRDEDVVMVPLHAAARQVGLNVEGDSNSRRIVVEDDETVLLLEQESKNFRLNGRKGTLPRNVTVRNGLVYVPVDALSAAKTGLWTVNGTRIDK